MKRLFFVAFLSAILCAASASHSQIVLEPISSGYLYGGFSGYFRANTDVFQAGCCVKDTTWDMDADTIITVDKSFFGAILFGFPSQAVLADLTECNFTAKLQGLDVAESTGSGTLRVDLGELGYWFDQDQLKGNIWHYGGPGPWDCRIHDFDGTERADFDDIDVTQQIRNDLFRERDAGPATGFYLRPRQESLKARKLVYDDKNPRVVITIFDAGVDCDKQTNTDLDAKCPIAEADSGGCGTIPYPSPRAGIVQVLWNFVSVLLR